MNKLKRIFGKAEIISPIIDRRIYTNARGSYTGNSLADSNLLIVTMNLEEKIAWKVNENCYYSNLNIKNEGDLCIENINAAGTELIGPFDHIINIFHFDLVGDAVELFPRSIFHALQVETEYLISFSGSGTICTAITYDPDSNIQVLAAKEGLRGLVEGLGTVLPSHHITSNGILATNNIPQDDLMKSCLFMSSKYGQILNGEVMGMCKS